MGSIPGDASGPRATTAAQPRHSLGASSKESHKRKKRDRRYFNRHPDDPWDFVDRCALEFINGRWRTKTPSDCVRAARGRHVFVVQDGELFLNRVKWLNWRTDPLGHIDLARGEPIEFGGEIMFGGSYSGRGVLRWWNDATGHYHDTSRPMDPRIVPLLPQEQFRRHDFGV